MPEGNGNKNGKSAIERIGCMVSEWAADIAAHPYAQIGIILFCAAWWLVGLPTDILTAALSILAITLTQMVLNRQNEREGIDHIRDVAMHAKLDELIIAKKNARNEMAGIEELQEEDIQVLKEDVKEEIDHTTAAGLGPPEKEAAKQAVEVAADKAKKESRSRGGNNRKQARRSSSKG